MSSFENLKQSLSILCLLFLVYLISNPYQDLEQKTKNILKEIAHARFNISDSSFMLMKSKYKDCSNKLMGELQDYTDPRGLKESIIKFIHDGLNFKTATIETDLLPQGASGNEIVKVVDNYGAPFLIIKVFKKEHEEWIEESSALQGAIDLKLHLFKLPKIVGFGKCTIEDKTYVLLAEQYIEGKTLKSVLHELANLYKIAESTQEKETFNKTFYETKNIFYLFGSALAEFHYSVDGIIAPAHPLLIDAAKVISVMALEKISAYPDKIVDIDMLKTRFDTLLKIMQSKKFQYGFMHGDANLGNYIYNNGIITMIDMPNASISFAQDLIPIGAPVYDYIMVKKYILEALKLEMPENLVQEIVVSFEKGYLTLQKIKNKVIVGRNPEEHEYLFFTLIDLLQKVLECKNKNQLLDLLDTINNVIQT